MTISKRIRSQLFVSTEAPVATTTTADSSTPLDGLHAAERVLIRLPLTRPLPPSARKRPSRAKPSERSGGLGWSDDEHERFLRGLEIFPSGPWKKVAAFVGTRTTRQVMTHAQKYRQKIARRQRGLRVQRKGDGYASDVLKLEPAAKAATLEPAPPTVDTGLSFALTASPSSAEDQLLHAFRFQTSAIAATAPLPEQVAMSADEFKLIDELFAEPTWAMLTHLDGDVDSQFISSALDASIEFECQL